MASLSAFVYTEGMCTLNNTSSGGGYTRIDFFTCSDRAPFLISLCLLCGSGRMRVCLWLGVGMHTCTCT